MTSSIGSVFNRGLEGININLRGLAAASNNIANVSTKGYARQVLQIGSNGFGSSVEIGIVSIVNPFIEAQLVSTANDFGTLDGRRRTVEQIESLFNEAESVGIGASMAEFFNAWSELSSDPSSTAFRQNLRERASLLTERFSQTYSSVEQMRRSLSSEMETRVGTINSLAAEVARLNQAIGAATDTGTIEELGAQRTFILRQLSEEVGIVTYQNESGDLQVQLENGANLVNSTTSSTLSLSDDLGPSGEVTIQLTLPETSTSTDITSGLINGRLGGNLIDRNTTLNTKLDELDELAYDFADQINTLHATGFGLNSNTGINFFSPLGGQAGAARNLAVDNDIMTDLDNIAAAAQDPAVSGVGDNGMAIQMFNLQTANTMSGASQSFSEYYQDMVGDVGVLSSNIKRQFESMEKLYTQIEIQRESVSGVNLDEEAASLIQFQRAFQASARLVAAADDMLASLLEL